MSTPGIVNASELASAVFGQTHPGTQDWFISLYGLGVPIGVTDTPHFNFISTGDPDLYREYIRKSWGSPPEEAINERVSAVRSMMVWFAEASDADIPPLLLSSTKKGRLIVVDGNHRAALSVFHKRDLRANVLSPEEFLARNSKLSGNKFYAMGHRGLPYQSVFDDHTELLIGRRRDTRERLELIRTEDIRDKTVLDVGCNIGASSFLASQLGASKVVGIDINRDIIVAAIRNNAYFLERCAFYARPLGRRENTVDTVLCFSVYAHASDKEEFIKGLDATVGRVLYFEGHSNSNLNDYPFLQSMFGCVDFLGFTSDGSHTSTKTRPVYRCERKNKC